MTFQKPSAATEETKEEKAPSPAKKAKSATTAGAAAAGGADVKEIVFSFDTTGSMYPCLTQVQNAMRSSKNNPTHYILKQNYERLLHQSITVFVNLASMLQFCCDT